MSVNVLDALIMCANFGVGEWAYHRALNALGVDQAALANPFLQQNGTAYYPVPPSQMRRALGLSTTAEMATVSALGLGLDRFIHAVSPPGLEMVQAHPWLPIALGLGCAHGVERLYESAQTALLRSGFLSQPDNRTEWSPAGRAVDETAHLLLRTAALWTTLTLCLPEDGALALEALVASATSILAEKLFPREFPAAALPQRMIEHRLRDLKVYHGYSPFIPRFRRSDIRQWEGLVTSLPLFAEPVAETKRHRDHHGLLWIRKSETDPLRGLAFFVANAGTYRDLARASSNYPAYFTERELSEIIRPRMERTSDPREILSKLTDLIEIKKAIWTFLTGKFPQGPGDWDPHEIEITRNPDSALIDYHLSERLEALRQGQKIGEIRTTWSDDGQASVGMLSFRRGDLEARILGTGIDLADHRQFLQRADAKPYLKGTEPQEPTEFFPEAAYRERYADRRPSSRELAGRHAVSEALYKAVYPKLPESERHGPHLYRQFGVVDDTNPWPTLQVTGEYARAVSAWGAQEARAGRYQIGPLQISIVLLARGTNQ